MTLTPLLPISLLLACSDQELVKVEDPDEVRPDIEVDPGGLEYGGVPYDSPVSATLTIRNAGNAGLVLREVELTEEVAFATPSPLDLPLDMAPGDEHSLEVLYSPQSPLDSGSLIFYSSDPVTPALVVPLGGQALYPDLVITPEEADLGGVGRCHSEDLPVSLANVGDAPLVISAIEEVGEGWSVSFAADLPLTIDPGGIEEVTVTFSPTMDGEEQGLLYVTSNDPAGLAQAEQVAIGDGFATDERVETFRQTAGPFDKVDLFFWVDQSSSMDDDRQQLKDNFAALSGALDATGVTWQALVATDDDGCANGDIIQSGDPEALDKFREAVVGPYGWFAESGLSVGYYGLANTISGHCNAGFMREGAKVLLVMVSDEADHSTAGWEAMVEATTGLSPGAAYIAIVGDVPTGCGSANPGTGYADAAMATDGDLLSICAVDWSEHFEDIAELITDEPTDTFVLDDPPDLDSLVVKLDGEVTLAWDWDAAANAVVFHEMPEAGAWIEVSYTISSTCE